MWFLPITLGHTFSILVYEVQDKLSLCQLLLNG